MSHLSQFILCLISIGYSFPGEIIYSCTPNEPNIHLSFDDAVTFPFTDAILDVLQQFDIKVTFFVLTSLITENNYNETVGVIQRMKDEGHTIGNHGHNHFNLISLNETQMKYEIDTSTQILTSILGEKPSLFRPPYAGTNYVINEYLKQYGYTTVLWNVGNVDWYYNNSDLANKAMSSMVTSIGGIFVMHNDYEGKNNAIGLSNLIKILNDDYNADNYTPPFEIANYPNYFKFVSFLECIGRDNVNDIPDYYFVSSASKKKVNTEVLIISIFFSVIIAFGIGYFVKSKIALFTLIATCCKCQNGKNDEMRPLTRL